MAAAKENGFKVVTVPYMRVAVAHEIPVGLSDRMLGHLIDSVVLEAETMWPRVVALAEALLQRRELSGEDATEVIEGVIPHDTTPRIIGAGCLLSE